MALWGKKGTGQNGTIPSYPQKCFILPQARPTYENFSAERD